MLIDLDPNKKYRYRMRFKIAQTYRLYITVVTMIEKASRATGQSKTKIVETAVEKYFANNFGFRPQLEELNRRQQQIKT